MGASTVNNNELPSQRDNVGALLQASSPSEAAVDTSIRELEWYQHFAKVTDVAEFTRSIRAFINRFGFSDFSYHRVECKSTEEACMITTPRRLSEYYDAEGAWRYDLVLEHCARKAVPIYRSTVNRYIENAPFETDSFARLIKLRDYTAKLGFYDYYHRSVKTTNGNGNAVLALTARNVSIEDFQVRIVKQESNIDMLTRVIDYVGTLKFPHHFMNADESREVIIRPKSLALLHAIAQSDLSLIQAADSLCMSTSSVHKHVATLKKVFEVKTLWGALYKAMQIGLIK